jgi:hypothetical protein
MSHSQDLSKLDYHAAGFSAPIDAIIECALGWAATARKDGHLRDAADYEDQHRRAVALSATTMPAPLPAPTAAAPPEQAEIDDGWAAAVSRAGHARATSRPAAPTPAPVGASARWPSAAEAEANWIEIALKLNAEAGARPRKAVRG